MSIKLAARIVSFILIAALIGVSVYLLTVGLETPHYTESREVIVDGQIIYEASQPTMKREKVLVAYYPLIALIVIGIGLLHDRLMPIAWLGLILMLIFAGMLLFSFILVCLAEAAVLAAPVSIIQWQISQKRRWLLVGWVGVALLLWLGLPSATYSAFFMAVLIGGVVMGLPLAWLTFSAFRQSQAASAA